MPNSAGISGDMSNTHFTFRKALAFCVAHTPLQCPLQHLLQFTEAGLVKGGGIISPSSWFLRLLNSAPCKR